MFKTEILAKARVKIPAQNESRKGNGMFDCAGAVSDLIVVGAREISPSLRASDLMRKCAHLLRARTTLLLTWTAILVCCLPISAATLSLFTPAYGTCGDVSINGVVLPSSGDTITGLTWNWGDGAS